MSVTENKVQKISVEGHVNMDERSVLSRLSVREGQAYFPAVLAEKVQSSVAALYESGFFDDVSAWIEYIGTGNDVHLLFKVQELPALDTFVIEGNDAISTDDLELKVSLLRGQVYSQSQLERDRQKMLEHYRSEGYLLAEVGFREIPVSEHENRVEFIIHEGEKVKIQKIEVNGNKTVPRDAIIEHMQSKVTRWWGEGEFKEHLFEADKDSVLNVARHFGFLDAELTEYKSEYLPDSSCRYYMGQAIAKDTKLALLYAQLNTAVQEKSNPMHHIAGKTQSLSSHYFRHHRKNYNEKAKAIPLPQVQDEESALNILNKIITYEELRKEWISTLSSKKWKHPKIAELLNTKKRSVFEEKLLVRYTLDETFSSLRSYDSVTTSNAIKITIGLHEGQRYYMGNVHVSGNQVLPEALLKSVVRLDSGEVFDYYAYDAFRKAFMDLYREEGYLFARFDETRTFESDSVVNLSFHFEEGLPAQVRKVYIRGNTKTKDKVIRREVRLFPGDTYRQSALERSFREIMQLNYFDAVLPDIKIAGEQEVDLDFMVSEREAGTGQFSLGLAYSQSDGLTFTTSIAIPNCCMGDGLSTALNAEYGEAKKGASLSFSDPWFLDKPITFGSSVSYTWWDGNGDPDITRYGASVYVGKRLKWPDDYFYGQVGYSWLMNDQGPNIDGSYILYSGLESAINFRLIRDDKNLPIFPTEGSRYELGVQVASPILASDFDFVKTDITIKWWFPIFRDKLALQLTNEYGIMIGNPLQYRTLYSMGGVLGYEGMMRGYSSGSIGYRRLGRSYQYIGAELQLGIVPNTFYLLPFFFDAGNVFGARYNPDDKISKNQKNPLKEWDPSSLKKDIGFGFRVIVPMLGIIGFDFAWPLDPGEYYSGVQAPNVGSMEFNFVIGQGF